MIKKPGHGVRNSHFELPGQLLLGIFFFAIGILMLLREFGRDYLSFIPESLLILIMMFGSIVGGFYLIITKIWRPRIYL